MSLLEKLNSLGDQLVTSEVPTPGDGLKLIGAIIHYLESGGLEPPQRAPSPAVQRQLSEDQAEIQRLRAEVEKLQQPASPSPAAPPTSPQAPQPPAGEPV